MGTKRYNRSGQLAYDNGFRAIYDGKALNGGYFVKDDKKCIYNMDSLLSQVYASSDGELEELGYDVEAYYRLNLYSRIR